MSIAGGPDIVENGLVLHLDAADSNSYTGSGTLWTDLSGNGYNGTLTNGPTYSSSNKGIIVTDGTNDYINLGNVLNVGTSSFTLECVAKKVNTGEANKTSRIATKGSYLQNNWTFYFGTYSYITTIGFFWGNPWSGFSYTVNDGQWYHAVITRDASNTITLYINGVSVSSMVAAVNFTGSENYTLCANPGGTENFTGSLGFWRHYNRALSATEILQNYNATKGRYGL